MIPRKENELAVSPTTGHRYSEIIKYNEAKERGLITTEQKRQMTTKNLAPDFLDFNETQAEKMVDNKVIKIEFK